MSDPRRRTRVTVRFPVMFPALIRGEGGIAVTKANGVYTIGPRLTDLELVTAIETADPRQIWLFNPDDGSYARVALQAIIDAIASGNSALPKVVTGSSHDVQDEGVIVVLRTNPVGDFTLNLPPVGYRNARALKVVDLSTGIGADGHNIILVPGGNTSLLPDPEAPTVGEDAGYTVPADEHVMRQATWTLFSSGDNFLASGTFWPSSLLNGWFTAP